MDLVVGATGNLGREICRELRARGRQVRALVRAGSRPEHVESLKRMEVELVVGDLKDPSSVLAACDGAQHVVSTASSTLSRTTGDDIDSVDRLGQSELVGAAETCGVEHIVFVSFPQSQLSFPLQDAKRAVETALITSSLTYTVLRPPHFLEGWFSPALILDAANAKARIFADGNARMSWVSMFDVARIAAISAGHPAARRRMLTFGGPSPESLRSVVAMFEEALGRPFEIENVPAESLRQQLRSARTPLERSFAALMLIAGEGTDWQFDNSDLNGIVDFELTSAKKFVERSVSGHG